MLEETGYKLTTPVLFIIFNRPDTTETVFDAIRKAAPLKLYIAADGPRKNREGEAERCSATRAIVKNIDWPCEVKTLFRDSNLGCKNAVSSAIDWFFENEEQGIILEDDCLPDPSFFTFCAELLQYYRQDERIMHIGGVNFQQGQVRGKASYYYSKYTHIWGWATWRRAWKYYDVNLTLYPQLIETNALNNMLSDKKEIGYWDKIFSMMAAGKIDTWDYQWTFAVWSQSGLSIVPNANLVSNIGFGNEATHTMNSSHSFANMPTGSVNHVTHPQFMLVDKEADAFTRKQINLSGYFDAFKNLIRKLAGK
jgi:hypothetical protein